MSLDAKIPPPVIAALAAGLMWGIAGMTPPLEIGQNIRWGMAAALLVVGIAISVSGVASFRSARTTVNPTQPARATALVDSGVFRFTRNPMYLGMACVLVAWAVFLASVWALLGVACFVLYMNRFQIAPEERALHSLFGGTFSAYTKRVRRWL